MKLFNGSIFVLILFLFSFNFILAEDLDYPGYDPCDGIVCEGRCDVCINGGCYGCNQGPRSSSGEGDCCSYDSSSESYFCSSVQGCEGCFLNDFSGTSVFALPGECGEPNFHECSRCVTGLWITDNSCVPSGDFGPPCKICDLGEAKLYEDGSVSCTPGASTPGSGSNVCCGGNCVSINSREEMCCPTLSTSTEDESFFTSVYGIVSKEDAYHCGSCDNNCKAGRTGDPCINEAEFCLKRSGFFSASYICAECNGGRNTPLTHEQCGGTNYRCYRGVCQKTGIGGFAYCAVITLPSLILGPIVEASPPAINELVKGELPRFVSSPEEWIVTCTRITLLGGGIPAPIGGIYEASCEIHRKCCSEPSSSCTVPTCSGGGL